MIHLILGMQGSGKTLLLTKVAHESAHKGKNIYSNIALKGIPYTPLDYDDIINYRLKDGVVLIDEIHQLLPARRFMSKTSVKIVDKFLSMVRKQGLEVYGTTQTRRKVDVRFREESDFEYFCIKYAWLNNRWIEVAHSQRFDKKTPILIHVYMYKVVTGEIAESGFLGNKWYDYYNTDEIIDINVHD